LSKRLFGPNTHTEAVPFFPQQAAADAVEDVVLPDVKHSHAYMQKGRGMVSRRDQIFEEAKEKGHAEGFEIGYREGREIGVAEAYRSTQEERHQLIESQIQDYGAFLQRQGDIMRKSMEDWFENAERELGNLAVVIAEKIIRRELESSQDIILAMAKEAMGEVTHASKVRILVNPKDRPFLAGYEASLKQISASVESIELVDDPHMKDGITILTEGGSVDMRVETHLRNLLESMLGEAA